MNHETILSVDVDVDFAATKRSYRKPEFTAHGTVDEVTLGIGSGANYEGASYVSELG